MNYETELKLVKSLSSNNTKIIKCLPYLLQDIWELGTNPLDVIHLVKSLQKKTRELRILDLGCGKGATDIHLAKILGCEVKGIDIVDEFITEAEEKTDEWNVSSLCSFECADINKAIKSEKNYDIVIYGAVGNVLGTPKERISKLKNTIKKDGCIIINESYTRKFKMAGYLSYDEWRKIFEKAKLQLINEKIIDDKNITEVYEENINLISKRANELKIKNPENIDLYNYYIEDYKDNYHDLKIELQSVLWVLHKK